MPALLQRSSRFAYRGIWLTYYKHFAVSRSPAFAHVVRQCTNLLSCNLLSNLQRPVAYPDYLYLPFHSLDKFHNPFKDRTIAFQQIFVLPFPLQNILPYLLDLDTREFTPSMLRKIKVGCLVHPKTSLDFVHVEWPWRSERA